MIGKNVTKRLVEGLNQRGTGKVFIGLACLFGLLANVHAADDNHAAVFELPSFDVEAYKLEIKLPVPVTTNVPRLRPNLAGTEVVMTFSVAADGRTYAITDNARAFDDRQNQLAAAMGLLVKKWRFEPALDKDGKAIAVRMALPVRAVLSGEGGNKAYARLKLEQPTITAVAKL